MLSEGTLHSIELIFKHRAFMRKFCRKCLTADEMKVAVDNLQYLIREREEGYAATWDVEKHQDANS